MNNSVKKVVVLGSWHKVIFMFGDRIPGRGESVSGNNYTVTAGGKGANQACICAKLGGNCVLIQKLGKDEDGEKAIDTFKDYLLDTRFVTLEDGEKTGFCCVLIDKNGENSLMTIEGSHGHYTKADIDAATDELKDAFMAGFVLETNLDATEYAIRKAHSLGVKVFLDPAPAQRISEDIYPCLTWIKPNEHEATILSGIDVTDEESAVRAAEWFRNKGVENVLITMGEEGSLLMTADLVKKYPAPTVNVVDTTTAGDVFAGAFLYALSIDMTLDDAVAYASCAGALCATRPGSIESAPAKEELEDLYRKFRLTIG